MSKEPKTDTENVEHTPDEKAAEQAEQNSEAKVEEKSSKMIEISETDHQKLVDEASGYKDKYVRLYAEFDNARKRMEREKIEFIKYANEELIVQFLNILDDLERAVQAAQAKKEDHAAFLKGVEMVMANIHSMLKKNGVAAMESKGKPFDHNCHEILMQEETDEYEDGIIIEEFQKGYYLGDRVVRTAKVKVAKAK
ncbi:MAG: nucleotide exchange factor GrpE [Candidatus Omnitrophica bacterium]|nr:nucleotide exchange factor GrpE [Candidatus Omnitrophota bacterium]